MPGFLQKLVPQGIKDYLKKTSGVPDMFFSLERLSSLGFAPRNILDVGAFEGMWTANCLKIFPDANYLMVEAMRQKETKLQKMSAGRANLKYEIALLGAREGMEVEFTELETASSVLEEVVTRHDRQKRTTNSLNTILERLTIPSVDLIKLDVQGYELEVLKGFDRFLPSTQAILTEVSLLDIHKGTPLVRDVVNFMYDYGFVMYDICSVETRRPLDNALWQTDLLFLKEDSRFRKDKRYNA
jgi:FkbM family methyltransferase